MNWEMIGALGELTGALAVVLTLFYLAHQVRDSAEEAKRTRASDLNREVTSAADAWASNDGLGGIAFRGFTNPTDLSAEEVFRFNASLFRVFRAWEALFLFSAEAGNYEWRTEGLTKTMVAIIGTPGAQVYWDQRREWFSVEFREAVDEFLRESTSTMIEDWHRNA